MPDVECASRKAEPLTRAENIREYVVGGALETFVGRLADDFCHEDGLLGTSDSVWDRAFRMMAPEQAALWSTDDDYEETAEWQIAQTCMAALVSRLFARLADHPERLRELSEHFAACAQAGIAKQLQELAGG